MYCRNCKLKNSILPETITNKCYFCQGRKGLKNWFSKDKNTQKPRKTRTKIAKSKTKRHTIIRMNKIMVNHLKRLASHFTDIDLIDFDSEIDDTLDYEENKRMILDKVKRLADVSIQIDLGLIDYESDIKRYKEEWEEFEEKKRYNNAKSV